MLNEILIFLFACVLALLIAALIKTQMELKNPEAYLRIEEARMAAENMRFWREMDEKMEAEDRVERNG